MHSNFLYSWFCSPDHFSWTFTIKFGTLHHCFMFQVIVFERGDLVFVFNFHPENTYDGYWFFVQGVDYISNIIFFFPFMYWTKDSKWLIYPWTNRYKVGCDLPGKYRVALDSDALEFGGHGRVSNRFYRNHKCISIML